MNLYWITCAVSLGGLLFGFDTGVISGCEVSLAGTIGVGAVNLVFTVLAFFLMPETKGLRIADSE